MNPEGGKQLEPIKQGNTCINSNEEEEKQFHQEEEEMKNELLFSEKNANEGDDEMKLDDEESASKGFIGAKIGKNSSNDLNNHSNDKINEISTKRKPSNREHDQVPNQPNECKEDLIENKTIGQIKHEPESVAEAAITHPEGQQSDNSNSSSSNSSIVNSNSGRGGSSSNSSSSGKEENSNNHNNDTNNNPNNDEEMEEDQECEEDKVDKRIDKSPNSQQGTENQEAFDGSSFLGRNRRVRQKSKLLMDFHCIELTKGSSGTRSTNRRSTTQSNRGQQGEPDVFETKYCRKCFIKTPHDFEGGCQACLYKKIIESHKRQKTSNQKSRSGTSRQQQQQELDKSQVESPATTATTTTTTNPGSGSGSSSSGSSKRKATKQGGSKQGGNSNSITSNTNNNVISNDDNIIANNADNSSGSFTIATVNNDTADTDAINIFNSTTNNNLECITVNTIYIGGNKQIERSKLDTWSPDEVAGFISSRGFSSEAELFKTQSVDGISLLLMQRTDFTHGLKIKLGPALKIYDHVCKLKKDYFLTMTHT